MEHTQDKPASDSLSSPRVRKPDLYDAVLENDKLTASDKLVLMAYIKHANEKKGWTCYPSLETLRRHSSLSERTVRGRIREFRNGKGFLTVLKEGKKPNARGHSLARVCRVNVETIVNAGGRTSTGEASPPELRDGDLQFLDNLFIPGYDQDRQKVTEPEGGGPATIAKPREQVRRRLPDPGGGPAGCAPQPVKEQNREESVLAKAERKKRAF